MTRKLKPIPDLQDRKDVARRIREEAAKIAFERNPNPVKQVNNGEAENLDPPFGTFTKGLAHDEWGGLANPKELETFIEALNQDKSRPLESPFPGVYDPNLPTAGLPAVFDVPKALGDAGRNWESPLAGHVYEINGPDADEVSMPPAPTIGSQELVAEMAEVYCCALVRDIAFDEWETDPKGIFSTCFDMAAKLPYFKDDIYADGTREKRRQTARFVDGKFEKSVFLRGSTPGAKTGPYVSQFLLIGNQERGSAKTDIFDALNRANKHVPNIMRATAATSKPLEGTQGEGIIRYGIQAITQQFKGHEKEKDYMTDWASWHAVQNGENLKGIEKFEETERFCAKPRDLATYVHFDQLYQAYLNACFIMLEENAQLDVGLPEGTGNETRDGFATFGGPHIITLVTEVSTRALKAVRRQKYNIHLRSRPEAIASALTLAWNGLSKKLGNSKVEFQNMVSALDELLDEVSAHNEKMNDANSDLNWIDPKKNGLLPMAFSEGSPMHPSYGAGHATVAGACVTILKAFFEMHTLPGDVKRGKIKLNDIIARAPTDLFNDPVKIKLALSLKDEYVVDPAADYQRLMAYAGKDANKLTLQGELDKLAANIAIGRDFAGVHYYTDYFESLRMGERIAAGMLQEQMLTYREPVSMRFESFDGDLVMITGNGGSRSDDGEDVSIHVWDRAGTDIPLEDWWNRALDEN